VYKKVIVTLVALVAIAGTIFYMKKSGFKIESNKYANLYEAFNLVESDGSQMTDDVYAVVISGMLSDYKAIYQNSVYYVRYETIRNKISDKFYWDSDETSILYTTPTELVKFKIGGAKYTKGSEDLSWDNDITLQINDDLYIDLEFVKELTGIVTNVYKSPNRICITATFDPLPYAYANNIDNIRNDSDVTAPIYQEAKIGEKLLLTGLTENDFTEVMTEDGVIGFIKTSTLTDTEFIATNPSKELEKYTSITREDKINLGWHQVTNTTANYRLKDDVKNTKGLNVISPTWLSVKSSKGAISSIVSSDYVDTAHDLGMDVWVLVDDFKTGRDGVHIVNEVISNTNRRTKLIKNIIKQVKKCGADGVNIDFEYITEENGPAYIEFIRELSIKCRTEGLVLSVDTYVPADWSYYYDRAAQAEVVDYVIIMAYDEYNTSSDDAGPVSSYSYVENGITNTIDEIGSDYASKVVVGLPFYTRIWTKTPEEYADKDAKIVEDSVNGNYAISSKAVGMDTVTDYIKENGIATSFDEESGLNYGSLTDDTTGEFTQIWIEDEQSLSNKLDLVSTYDIAGAAFWKLTMETDSIWDMIDEKLK